MTDNTCALCGVSFGAADIVPLNGTDEQVGSVFQRLESVHDHAHGMICC